jgi:hypothetical protein
MTISEQQATPDAVTFDPIEHAAVWFGSLFDDAALFPPRRAHVTDAVVQHRAWRRSGSADYVGPFVCSDAQWGGVRQQLEDDDAFAIALTVPGGVIDVDQAIGELEGSPVSLAQIEIPVHTPDEQSSVVAVLSAVANTGVDAYVELPIAAVTPAVCEQLAASGLRLKVRTGGADADAFPSETELATVISTCVSTSTRFKLTAGLHHAVRHRALKTGFEHHGFLNVLLATSAAIRGSDISCVATMLGLEHPSVVAASLRSLERDLALAVRDHFVSFGTCSIDEPLEDLVGLGLIAGAS